MRDLRGVGFKGVVFDPLTHSGVVIHTFAGAFVLPQSRRVVQMAASTPER